MENDEIQALIRQRVNEGCYHVKLHALLRSNERGIMPSEIRDALLTCVLLMTDGGKAALFGAGPGLAGTCTSCVALTTRPCG